MLEELRTKSALELEEGEVTESGGEQSEEEENHQAISTKNANSPTNIFAGAVGNEKRDIPKRRRNDTPGTDNKKESSRKHLSSRKSDRKRNEDRESRGYGKSRRKSPEVEPDASFEDELDAYQNSQRKLPRGRDRELSEGRESRRRTSPNPRKPRANRLSGPRSRPARESAEVRPSRKEKKVPCKFFLEGRCKFGDDCPFSHDHPQTRKLEACKFYAGGACTKGPLCVYMHKDFPCKFFHTGQKCFSGDNCRFTHDRLSAEQKFALENYLEKDNKFAHDRAHRENPRPPSPSPPQDEYRDASRGGLLPTPNEGSSSWDNTRRRPDFFRETLPDRSSQEPKDFRGTDSYIDRKEADRPVEYDRRFESFEAQRLPEDALYKRVSNQEEFPFRDNLPSSRPYGDMLSPRTSEHSDDAFTNSVAPQAPKLLARLQQRAQQMMLPDRLDEPAVKEGEISENRGSDHHYALDESPERSLIINEPASQEPEIHPQAQHSLPAVSQWDGSDDEDDGSDQFLANSLKRLQEQPNRANWNRIEGDWRSNREFQAYTIEPFNEEQLSNHGKVLLSVPLPQDHYYPTQQEFVPNYEQQGPEYMDQHWPYPDQQVAYQHPYAPEPFQDPHSTSLPPTAPVAAAVDPRLARAGNFDFTYPSETDVMQLLPVESQVISGTPTLEAVMQQLLVANKLSSALPKRTVEAAEIEASLEKNPEPPMYRLEPFMTGTVLNYNAPLYERLLVFRTAEELAIDPRISKITKILSASIPRLPDPVIPSKAIFSLDPTDADESKKASQDFDAITAMLAQALKKREAEAENEKSIPQKKMRRVVATHDSTYAVS